MPGKTDPTDRDAQPELAHPADPTERAVEPEQAAQPEPAAQSRVVDPRRMPGHRIVLRVGGREFETLADLPPRPGRLLFVGLNPSPVSVAAGHYHQGRLGRAFWRRLVTATVLPKDTDLAKADDALVAADHGITDLLKLPSPRDEATDDELRAGVGPLWQKIALWRPAAVVFIYKRAAEASAGRRLPEPWGQLHGVALAGRPCFLMPGPYAPREEVAEGLNLIRNLSRALPRVAGERARADA